MANAFTPQQYAESYKNAFQSVNMPNPADYGNMTATPEMYAPTPSGTPWDILAGMGSQMQYKRAAEEAMANKVAYDAAVKDATLNKESVEYGIKMSDKAAEAANKPSGGATPYSVPVQTDQGLMSFDTRTQKMTPLVVGGKTVVGSQWTPELQDKIAAAKAQGKYKGETQAAAEMDMPYSKAKEATALKMVDDLIGHKGFQSAVGFGSEITQYYPAGSDTANWHAYFNQVKGGAFLEAFKTLKGGGQITEIEGQKATEAVTRMSIAQSEEDFKLAANDFKQAVKDGYAKLQNQAKQLPEYQYPNPSGKPQVKGGWKVLKVESK